MRPVRIALPAGATVTLGAAEAIAAIALLAAAIVFALYLQVLHEAVAHGALARTQPVAAATPGAERTTALSATAPLGVGRAQLVAR